MAEYITLVGAEDVRRAANTMQEAASEMQRAAGYIDSIMREHRVFMDDWLSRLIEAMKEKQP